MKPIRFTSHALEKIGVVRGWGFPINEETVIGIIRRPEEVLSGYSDRLIALAALDEEYILRVVYEEDGEIIVITLYPRRRS